MLKRSNFISALLLLSMLTLAGCNLPSRQVSQSQTPSASSTAAPQLSATPISQCNNEYYPAAVGNTWSYSGTNSAIGTYTRDDTVTSSTSDGFTIQSTEASVAYTANFSCTADGILSADPLQQYAGALLSSPNAPVTVKLTSNSGLTLPAHISSGDTWQQTAGFDATSTDINMSGTFVFNYSAVGYEQVTVPFGTFTALRVDTTVRVEVTGLRILAGTYTVSSWLAPQIGIIKSEGTSHVSGIDFSDSMQLTGFNTSP